MAIEDFQNKMEYTKGMVAGTNEIVDAKVEETRQKNA